MPKSPENFPLKEQKNETSSEKEVEEKLSSEEAEEVLTGLEEYNESVRVILAEKRAELDIETDPTKIAELNDEIMQIESYVEGLIEFAEKGRQEDIELFRDMSNSKDSEEPSNTLEEEQELFPTSEEVQAIFEQLVGGGEYEEIRKLEDEQGLYLWEIRVSGEDEDREYSYRRGRPSVGELPDFRVDVYFFDEDGIPAGGHSAAKYIDKEWKLTP